MDYVRLKQIVADDAAATGSAIEGAAKSTWTALRGLVSKDSDGHTTTVKAATRVVFTGLDGKPSMVELPPLDTSPVHYPGGGGHTFTHPVKKDDEGVALFMSRSLDEWYQSGGVQDQKDHRKNHLSDSVWIPGGRSVPRKLKPAPSSVSSQQRDDKGAHTVDVNQNEGVTHASKKKVLTNVGGASGSGTAWLIDKIIKNAPKVLINSITAANMPPPGMSFANKKLIATMPVGGMQSPQIASIMSGVMSGGIGSLLSSPIASALTGALSGVTGAVSAITGALGAGGAGVVSALTGAGGLSTALGALGTGASALAGATAPAGGAYGLLDLLNHAGALSQYFGASPPAAVSLATVTAPLDPSTLTALQTQLATVTSQAISGAITPAAAASQIAGMTASINAIMPASALAMSTLQAASPALSLALLAGDAGISLDPNVASVGAKLAGPNIAALQAAMAAIFQPSAEDAAAILAFPDREGGGAMGGFS